MHPFTSRLAPCAAIALLALAGASHADELIRVDFEDSNPHGWSANGVPTIFDGGGNPGNYLALPLGDYHGVSLNAREPESMILGDLTKVGPLRLSFDVLMSNAYNFFGDNIDLSQFPMVFELFRYGDPGNGAPYTSVYIEGRAWPNVGDGWVHVSFDLPDPSSTELPAGWGGTGDEDPKTFEPRLPPGITYNYVLSQVDEVRVTTFRPGYFYIASFWEVGFDNIVVETIGNPCPADFNTDGTVNSQDFFDYLTAFFTSVPAADFNTDGTVNSQDFFDFLTAFFVGC